MYDIDVDEILVCKEKTYALKNSSKYSIEYNGNGDIRPLRIMLPQMLNALKAIRQCLLRLMVTNC